MNIARRSNQVPKPTECLCRVFVPILRLHLLPPYHQQTRLISDVTTISFRITKPSHRPRDESILSRLVQLVPEGSNQLLSPEPPSRILARIDRTKFFLVQVSGPESPKAICKIISKREEREYELKKPISPKQGGPKELEFKWNIGPYDLKRKMETFREFLEEGRKVDIRLQRRKKWENPSPQEVSLLEGAIQEAVDGVVGTTEYRPRQDIKAWGGEKGIVNFYFKGPAKKRTDGKESRRMAREQETEEKKEKRKKRAEERQELVQNALKANV